jgi:hypothetical protein
MAISTNFCTKGEWKEGNSIITIARNTMKNHNQKKIFESLGKLLKFISENFPEVDVRDRSNFYFSLLTHVPKEKLNEILDFSSPFHSNNEDPKNSLQNYNNSNLVGNNFDNKSKNKSNSLPNFLKFQKVNKGLLNLSQMDPLQSFSSIQNTSEKV